MSSKRVILLFVLSLALILVPFSYTTLQAQDTQSGVQNQQYPSNQSNQSDINRTDKNMPQNQNQDLKQDQKDYTTESNQNRLGSTQGESNRQDLGTTESDDALPRTAGELPLLALAGILSLFAAAALRLVPARQRR
jgi:hypothetical protein